MMMVSGAEKKAERPKKPSRREVRQRAILEAANALFLEKGYGATNLTDIVKVSGGSLATLYELFGGKAGLFRAMIEKECAEFFEFLESEIPSGLPPEETLRAFATRFVEEAFADEGGSLMRLIAAEAVQFPEIGVDFYNAGPAAAQRMIAEFLRKDFWSGVLSIDDPDEAAATLVAMLFHHYQMRQICGLPLNLTRAAIDRHVDRVIAAFMKVYRTAEKFPSA